MILYRANATYREIMERVRAKFMLDSVPDKTKSVEKQVWKAVGYCTQVRIKHACEPVFQSLSHLETSYASLNYKADDRRLVVVRNNMGTFLRQP